MTTDIKPDTSLYEPGSANFYRACALVAERGVGIEMRKILNRGDDSLWYEATAVDAVGEWDHRLKPGPRVVWVNFNEKISTGKLLPYVYESEECARNIVRDYGEKRIATAVRVELPE